MIEVACMINNSYRKPFSEMDGNNWLWKVFWSAWRYDNSQNTAISLKPIHFFDKIKPILYQQAGNSMT